MESLATHEENIMCSSCYKWKFRQKLEKQADLEKGTEFELVLQTHTAAMRIHILLVSIIVLASSCATNTLTLTVKEPPVVLIPKKTFSAGVIDRSLPEKKSEGLNKFEKILTAEGVNLDKEAGEEAFNGLKEGLINTALFDGVKDLKHLELRTPTVSMFPSPLTWEEVDRICAEEGVNMLFSLEMYDTDTKLDFSTTPTTVKGPLGIDIPGILHNVQMTVFIKTGWRLYNPELRVIHDEIAINDQLVYASNGINPIAAVTGLLQRKEAVKQASNRIGFNYPNRILPYNIRVSRDYFVRGSNAFRVGKRMARTGNWDGAAEMWDSETLNPRPKIAGRAFYNMGISNEINGDLNTAIDWVRRSYEETGNRKALRYLRKLEIRSRKQQILQE